MKRLLCGIAGTVLIVAVFGGAGSAQIAVPDSSGGSPTHRLDRVLDDLEADAWAYWYAVKDEPMEDAGFADEMLDVTAKLALALDSENGERLEARKRSYSRILLARALVARAVLRPTTAAAAAAVAKQYKGYSEGYAGDWREEVKEEARELDEWLAQFGYFEIHAVGFRDSVEWARQEVGFSVKQADAIDGVEPEVYAADATRSIRESVFSSMPVSKIALPPGIYYLAGRKSDLVIPQFVTLHRGDNEAVVVEPDYRFKLTLLDQRGNELDAKAVKLYRFNRRVESSNLDALHFGDYRLFGTENYDVPDSVASIRFRLNGTIAERGGQPVKKVVSLEHEDAYAVTLVKKQRGIFGSIWHFIRPW